MTFKPYQRKAISWLKPWEPTDDMSRVSVSQADKENGSPKTGDMIARNPKDWGDQWLVAGDYFVNNFEALTLKTPTTSTDS